MLVKDLMTKDVVCVSSEDPVSNALSKMKQHSINQLPIVDNNEVKGILILRKIITRDINPATTKVGSLARPTSVLREDEPIETASNKILQSGLRAMPVTDGKNITGILSETDLLKLVEDGHGINKVMSKCDYVTVDDDIGKVRKLMAYKSVSRVPILDKGSVVGVIGALDLIDVILKAKQPMDAHAKTKDRGFRGPLPLYKIKVETIMKPPTIVNKDTSVKEVANLLSKKEEVIIKSDNEFCIVTPKDILEISVKPERGVYFYISNLGDEDPLTADKIDQAATEFIQKIGRTINKIESLYLHIERHKKLGKTKFSVRTRFHTPFGLFVSKAWGWELATVTQESLNKLEREVKSKYGKIKSKKRVKA